MLTCSCLINGSLCENGPLWAKRGQRIEKQANLCVKKCHFDCMLDLAVFILPQSTIIYWGLVLSVYVLVSYNWQKMKRSTNRWWINKKRCTFGCDALVAHICPCLGLTCVLPSLCPFKRRRRKLQPIALFFSLPQKCTNGICAAFWEGPLASKSKHCFMSSLKIAFLYDWASCQQQQQQKDHQEHQHRMADRAHTCHKCLMCV